MMNPKRLLTVGTLVLLPAIAGGFVLQRRVPDSARLFAEVFDRVLLSDVDSLSADALYEKAARGLVHNLNDPYAGLYSPAQLANFSRNSLGNSYGGVGMLVEDQRGNITVSKVFANTPASGAGVQAGDRIVAVDSVTTRGQTLDQVTNRLIGTVGTSVSVTFTRLGVAQPITSRFRRSVIHVPSVPFAIMIDNGVGYVPLQRFNDSAAQDAEQAIRGLLRAGARAIVLDLRGNGGGDLDQSLAVSNLFLAKGQELASVRFRGSTPQVYQAKRAPILGAEPVVVLTDGYSASASEIVAGSLQDHDRALVVGTTSFGKGLVQSLFMLSGGWGLKLTTGRWYTPSGRSIQKERKVVDGQLVLEDEQPDSLESDSVRRSRPVFRSDVGRVVYGGGGVTPDVIVPADTISSQEQRFLRALAPWGRQSYAALYELALELKGKVRPGFTVQPAWRDQYFAQLQKAGAKLERAQFDSVSPLIDRMLGQQITTLAFGDSAAFRRSIRDDTQLETALALLRAARTQPELLAAATERRGES